MLKVGDICSFDGSGTDHFKMDHGTKVRITRVGQTYTYPGMNGKTCEEIDFEEVETGIKHVRFSSQWVDKIQDTEDDGCDF